MKAGAGIYAPVLHFICEIDIDEGVKISYN